MPSFNKVFLIGHITHDPTEKTTSSGKAVASFSIAINRPPAALRTARAGTFHTTNGVEKDTVCFFDVVAWEAVAQACAQYLKAGSLVFVEGELSDNRWEQDGKKRKTLSVVARSVQFLSKPSELKSTRTHPEKMPTPTQPPAPPDLQTDVPDETRLPTHPPFEPPLRSESVPPDLPTV